MKKIAIIGAGGHAKVIIDIISEIGNYVIVGFFDDNKFGTFCNIPILGKINEINIINKNIEIDTYIIGIGNDRIRQNIYETHKNINWDTLIHPKTIISKTSIINYGTVICAGSIIQTEANIGKHCIVNTNSNIDHESKIGDFCSICPGVTICGQVIINNCTMIGANSVIIQNINIGNNCIIGAGSVVIRDIQDNQKVVGNPIKFLKNSIN